MIKLTAPSTTVCAIWLLLFGSAYCLAFENNDTDYAALMAFRSHLILQTGNILSTNWTSTTHYCNWFGVSCSNNRVTNLELSGLGIQGDLSSEIANMTHLVVLDLSNNGLRGILPIEMGFLQQLRVLDVSQNSLQGGIPANLSMCRSLRLLDFSNNFIKGNIPASFGNFSKLHYFILNDNNLEDEIPPELGKITRLAFLAIKSNNLTGPIPPSLFNISTLRFIDLSGNELSGQLPKNLGEGMPNLERLLLDSNRITGKLPISISNASKLTDLYLKENDLHGEIPNDFGRLPNLRRFDFELNQISGGIPYEVFNVTSLEILKTRHNYLSGDLPHDFGNWLPNLQEIYLSDNQFSGPIPSSICNATKLVILEVANNSFSGPIPMKLGNLVALKILNLEYNSLINNPDSTYLDFLNSLANCRNLRLLVLDSNPLNGIIPESVGNLSSILRVFTAISCQLKGGIPRRFGSLSSLYFLGLSSNDLQGEVPSSFFGIQYLERLYLRGNKLEGSIPAVLCSINTLGIMDLGGNNFSGPIPTCIQDLTELTEISLAANKLNSTIPLGFWKLKNVKALNLSKNLLQGSIPAEARNLQALNIMDLSLNDFSGEIPSSIGSIRSLLKLDISQNNFQGPIPNTLSNLIFIHDLDLSSNGLSGDIPSSLGSLRDLQYLNLSFNRLQGEIPRVGVFTNITYQSLMGNPNLCGAPKLNYPLCSPQIFGQRKKRMSFVLKITIPLAATFLLVFTMILLWIKFSNKKPENATETESSPPKHQIITYLELVRATESFSVTNLVGKGRSCMVYKGELSNGTVGAIKVFNMQYAKALKNFHAECQVLSKVRHRNLVKIISTCTNLEFKAMVLEFMPNGSLDKWLHSQSSSLSLVERLNIIIDVALATEYLHHEYVVPIVHCDLKPANVLLDEDMTAHVADFGISKILAQDQQFIQTRTLGTIGYIAPEYGLDGQASTKGDIYSFGILLLETFTGKRPTDEMFKEGLSLHQWVYQVFPDSLIEVLDSNLFSDMNSSKEASSTSINRKQKHIEELLVSIIHVALLCLKELPRERIEMRSVVVQLKKIRAELMKKITNKTRKLP